MSFNLDGKGRAIAKAGDRVIFLDPDNNTGLKHIRFNDGLQIQIPNMEDPHLENKGQGNPRDVCFIAGPSGSGKSMYAASMARGYRNIYPNRPIFVFSLITGDAAFQGIRNLTFVDDKKFIEETPQEDIKWEDFENSLCIFDDMDQLPTALYKKIVFFRQTLIELGRKKNISIITTAHMLTNWNKTRTLLSEAQTVTFFPRSNFHVIENFLKNYVGLTRKQMNRIQHANSRWCTVFQNYPPCIMNEHEIYLLNKKDDD